jgi:hypothetical protein
MLQKMNLKLSEGQISTVCHELLCERPALSGRALREELKRRYGSAGKKDRVYALWRSIRASASIAPAVPLAGEDELNQQLADARRQIELLETSLFDMEQRALRAEAREQLHQDRWANEIHELREALRHAQNNGR